MHLVPLQKPKRLGGKSKSLPVMNSTRVGERDASLVLFHAIGKILAGKRTDSRDRGKPSPLIRKDTRRLKFDNLNLPNPIDPLPDSTPSFRLDTHRPHALLFDPEKVFESSHTSPCMFQSFLFQNYPCYYESVEEVIDAAEWQVYLPSHATESSRYYDVFYFSEDADARLCYECDD